MRYFCNRGPSGEIVSTRRTVQNDDVPGMEEITEEAYEEWLAGLAEPPTEPEENVPSEAERLRADIDYLAALQGVEL